MTPLARLAAAIVLQEVELARINGTCAELGRGVVEIDDRSPVEAQTAHDAGRRVVFSLVEAGRWRSSSGWPVVDVDRVGGPRSALLPVDRGVLPPRWERMGRAHGALGVARAHDRQCDLVDLCLPRGDRFCGDVEDGEVLAQRGWP